MMFRSVAATLALVIGGFGGVSATFVPVDSVVQLGPSPSGLPAAAYVVPVLGKVSDDACFDSVDFRYKGVSKKTCGWVGKKSTKKQLCKTKRSIRKNCPFTCENCGVDGVEENDGGCVHMDVDTFCSVSDRDNIHLSFMDECQTFDDIFCLKEALVTYDVCVNKGDIESNILSLINNDLSNVNIYFEFKLMLNGMEQEIDTGGFSYGSSKGLCLRYKVHVDGCETTKLDFTAGVKFLPNTTILRQEQCIGNDPFASKDNPARAGAQPQELQRKRITLTLPPGVYNKTELDLLPTVRERTLYVKETLTRCNDFLEGNKPTKDITRRLEVKDSPKRFKIKSKKKKIIELTTNKNGKKKKFSCKKLALLNLCNMQILGRKYKDKKVNDLCLDSCQQTDKTKDEPTDTPTGSPTVCEDKDGKFNIEGGNDKKTCRQWANNNKCNKNNNNKNNDFKVKDLCPVSCGECSPTDASTPIRASDILGCKFVFDSSDSNTPFAMGPLRLSTNVLNAIDIAGYQNNKYTPIFKNFAIPELITNSCLEFDGGIGNIESSVTAYADSASYTNELQKANSISVSSSFSFLGFSASAGYTQSTEKQTKNTGKTQSAYGTDKIVKEFAKIDINCLNKQDFIDLELQDLILQNVVDDWTYIRNFSGNISELQKTDQFKRVANGGFIIPKAYQFSATVRRSIETLYSSTTSSSSETVSNTITTELGKASTPESPGGKVGTDIANSVTNKLQEENIASSSVSTTTATGTVGITADCLDTPGGCEAEVTKQVELVFDDINNLVTVPSTQIGSVDLNEIVKGYFKDNEGFPPLFFKAVDEYFQFLECDQPNCPRSLMTTVSGVGIRTPLTCDDSKISRTLSCNNYYSPSAPNLSDGEQLVCDSSRYFTSPQYRKDKNLEPSAVSLNSCDISDNLPCKKVCSDLSSNNACFTALTKQVDNCEGCDSIQSSSAASFGECWYKILSNNGICSADPLLSTPDGFRVLDDGQSVSMARCNEVGEICAPAEVDFFATESCYREGGTQLCSDFVHQIGCYVTDCDKTPKKQQFGQLCTPGCANCATTSARPLSCGPANGPNTYLLDSEVCIPNPK